MYFGDFFLERNSLDTGISPWTNFIDADVALTYDLL